MKKIILIALAFVLAFPLHSISADNYDLGGKLNVGIANITDNEESIGPKLGFQIGGYGRLHVSNSWSIHLGALYTSNGASGDLEGYEVNFNWSYLYFPLRVNFNKNNPGLGVFGGVFLGLDLGSKIEMEGAGYYNADGLSSTDIGILFGLEYLISDKIGLDVQIQRSVASIFKKDSGHSFYNIQMLLGIMYKFN